MSGGQIAALVCAIILLFPGGCFLFFGVIGLPPLLLIAFIILGLAAWLFAFAFRVASVTRRRAYRRRETSGDPDLSENPGPLPDEGLVREERRRLILAALQGIALERRAVFVLYELDETPMADIATALGIPVNTAYSRLRAARVEFAAAVRRLEAKAS